MELSEDGDEQLGRAQRALRGGTAGERWRWRGAAAAGEAREKRQATRRHPGGAVQL